MRIENKYKVKDWDLYYLVEKKLHILPLKGFFISYDIYLCDIILDKFLFQNFKQNFLDNKNRKICEIGCGDGYLLRKLSEKWGCEPFGIEYSKPAAEIARKSGINVIEGDVFNDNLLKEYYNFFDIVYSYGFVEHIIPPEKAIEVHLKILKPGGYFFIHIPRLKYFNYWKFRFFRPDLLRFHNLEIMEADKLRELCKKYQNVEEIFCKNYGTFKMRVPMDKKNLKYYILKILCFSEYLTNPLFRFLFKDHGFETKFFSPAVIFIGRKKY